MKPGDDRPTGQMLLAEGLITIKVSPAGYLEDVLVVDARGDLFYTTMHLEVVRLLCGDESVALLQNTVPCKVQGSAWLATGGDVENAHEGLKGLLHTIDRPAEAT